MFYSHQLLALKPPLGQTGRIAATLHGYIERRKIEKPNIVNICGEILNSSMPMALRLSGIHTGAGVIVNERKVKHLYALEMGAEDNQPLSTDNQNEAENEQKKPNENYRMPLVWIDLEMTGLNVEVDRILEIACIITDGNLTKSVEGPNLVIHQSKECLEKMGEWCQKNHTASGLIERVLLSSLTEREAEEQVIEFVMRHAGSSRRVLAGNSVYIDFIFLKKYMPKLAAVLYHVVVDVSSVKALCVRWFPKDSQRAPVKIRTHRAIDDIRESIAELKYFKRHIFKPKTRKG